MKAKTDNSCHLLIETTRRTRQHFKEYCRRQGCSMRVGLNALMKESAKRNFRIKTKFSIKLNESKA